MFPFRTSSIFRSRWMACLWAAGICWIAYDLVPAPGDDARASAAPVGARQDPSASPAAEPYDSPEVNALRDAVDKL